MVTTYTWLGTTSSDATNPANWSPSGPPANGDTAIFLANSQPFLLTGGSLTNNTLQIAGSGDTLGFVGTSFTSDTVALGSLGVVNITDATILTSTFNLAGGATIDLTGTTATSFQIDPNGGGSSQTQFIQTSTAGAVVINAAGTINSNAFILATQAGGTLDLNVAQNGTANPGMFISQGPVLNLGETIVVNADTNASTRFANNGFMLDAGMAAAADIILKAGMASVSGATEILGAGNGATLDVANNMPGSQSVIFGDGAGMLKIEAGKAGKFGAHILGLQTADTIELVGLNGTGDTFSYGTSTTYGHDVLVIQSGATVVAALRIAGDWLDSSGTIGGASTGNFNVTASGTNTFIVLQSATSGAVTVTPTIADWAGFTVSGGTVDWGASGQWTGGSGAGGLPGANQAVDIAMSATEISNFQTHGLAKYTLTINSAESAGSVIFADPAATLVINNTLSLAAPTGGHGGAFFSEQGRVHITGAGTVSATSFLALSPNGLTIDPGGSIGVSGAVPYTTGYGLAGLTLNQGVTITDGTISSGGAIAVGANDLAYAFVQSSTTSVTGTSVTDTYASIGGYNFVNTSTNTASLTITGPKTVWNDTNADASTPYAGSMLVGGGLPALSSATSGPGVKSGGAGVLTVDNSATLNDANFAVLGVTAGSSGSATVQNGARWNIGTAASTPPSGGIVFGTSTISAGQLPWLSVGLGGSGSLQMMGGNVALGAGEASGTYKMAVGVDSGASGFVNMTSTSTLDTGGGPLAIGVSGSGTLDVSDSAAVNVNNGGSVTGINAGLVLGLNAGATGTLAVGNGVGGSRVTDGGDFVDGFNGAGAVSVSDGGNLQIGGTLYIGGNNVGGTLTAGAGAVHSSFIVTSNATAASASAAGLTMWAGNSINLNGGGFEIGTGAATATVLTVEAGHTIQGGGTINAASFANNGVIIASGLGGAVDQTLDLVGVLGGAGQYLMGLGGTLEVNTPGSQVFDFGAANSGTLTTHHEGLLLQSAVLFSGTITNFFGAGNTVDLVGIGTVNGAPVYNSATGAISVSGTGGTANFTVTGYHPLGFTTANDGSGGIFLTSNNTAPCFAAGTRILTASGERAVEALGEGDLVPTLLGAGLRRVVWIGHTRIDLDRHPRAADMAPIRIAADAFGPGQPHRDLLVSPDHALFVEGALIPAHLLVNGATIRREPARGSVTYFHVELDSHDILLAEGLAAESYLDTGNRAAFANGGAVRRLHADFARDSAWDDAACAPLLQGGPRVAACHAALLARAVTLGLGLSDDAAPCIEADGRVIALTPAAGGRLRAALPAGRQGLRLRSRVGVPADVAGARADHRRLGVAVTGAWLDGVALDLAGPAFGAGFYAPERHEELAWRWSDGAGELALPAGGVLELALRPGWLRYWERAPAMAAAG